MDEEIFSHSVILLCTILYTVTLPKFPIYTNTLRRIVVPSKAFDIVISYNINYLFINTIITITHCYSRIFIFGFILTSYNYLKT